MSGQRGSGSWCNFPKGEVSRAFPRERVSRREKRVAVDKPTLSDPVCVSGWSEVSMYAFLGGAGWRGQ